MNSAEAFVKIFESAPDLYLLLSADLHIVNASDAYLDATLTKRAEITGRRLFDVFPDNPEDPNADGVSNLNASLQSVLKNKVPHIMPIQKYDIASETGVFEERFWKPVNSPVLNESNEVVYIIHKVEDVTEQERGKSAAEQAQKDKEVLKQTHVENLKESEARFFKMFNLSPVSIHMTEVATGQLVYVNRAFENLFKMHSSDVIGKTTTELSMTSEGERADTLEQIKECGGRVTEMEISLRIGTGELKSMLMSVEMIDMDNKRCFLVAMVDISQRKQAEEALNKANRFLDTILENIPDMVFVKDADDLKFVRFNKAGEQMLGYRRDDLIGKNDYDFFPKEQADFFISKDRTVLRKEKLVIIDEEPIQTRHGERWLHTKKIPILENGMPVYLVGISADITEQKKDQDAIIQLNKELEAFTYSVSHDLRTPLRAITGYAQILEEDYAGIVDHEGRRLLRIISHNAEKMGTLIDDLLRFSRLGKKELQLKETNLRALVDAAIADLGRAGQNKAQIRINVTHKINSDESLMKLVLINLIGNAIKYSSKKEAPVIEIESKSGDNEIILSVGDNGVGFDMRYVDKLFGVFQRLHSMEEFEGTGVGLAIVQRIISKHGGRVWAEGKVNEGATIYFSIPQSQSMQAG